MSLQPKKEFAFIDYNQCDPRQCDPDRGTCPAEKACSHKVIKQMDGAFEPPMVFQHMCMGCRDCVEACRLDAIQIKHIT